MESVRQVRLAIRLRGIEGDGAQELIVFGTIRNLDVSDAVTARVGPGGEKLGPTSFAS